MSPLLNSNSAADIATQGRQYTEIVASRAQFLRMGPADATDTSRQTKRQCPLIRKSHSARRPPRKYAETRKGAASCRSLPIQPLCPTGRGTSLMPRVSPNQTSRRTKSIDSLFRPLAISGLTPRVSYSSVLPHWLGPQPCIRGRLRRADDHPAYYERSPDCIQEGRRSLGSCLTQLLPRCSLS
jgi:hypothetical protein